MYHRNTRDVELPQLPAFTRSSESQESGTMREPLPTLPDIITNKTIRKVRLIFGYIACAIILILNAT